MERLTREIKGSSAAKIVMNAIDSYNPTGNLEDVEQKELIAIAYAKVKEAIESTENTIEITENTIEIVDNCLESLSKKRA